MQSKDLRSLLLKLDNYLVRNLDTATGLGIKRNHVEITFDHLWNALLEDGRGDIPCILKFYGVDMGRFLEICHKNLDEQAAQHADKPKLSPHIIDLLDQAWIISSVHHKEQKIRSGALFEAFIASDLVISSGYMDLLGKINQEDLRANFYSVVRGSVEGAGSSLEEISPEDAREIPADATVLDLYTVNMTELAKQGKIDPIHGRDDEIIQMIENLSRRKKSNPILLGEPGVGKTAVVEGLALKIAQDEVPDHLKNVQILNLDLGALQAGTKMRGEFEKRLKAVISEVTKSSKSIILFIDEAHTLIGAGNTAGGGDAANMLKPSLARGELRAIAATTYLEYNKYFAKDAALERRFQPIHIGEPDDEKAILMLRGIKEKYENHHGIHITDEALEDAVKLSRRYIAGRQLPDKAIDMLDTAATRVKMTLTSKPPALQLLISRLHSIELKIASLQKDSDLNITTDAKELQKLIDDKTKLEKEIKEREDRWQKESDLVKKLIELRKTRFAAQDEAKKKQAVADLQKTEQELKILQGELPQVFADVTTTTVAEVIESWTGIPVGNMTQDEMGMLAHLEDNLKKRVIGQDHAIKQVADAIRAAKLGLKKEEGPIGTFLLVGSSGVGKTELARAAAEVLFGDERFMVTLNMTEYQNEYNTSRLIGADPGLVGYGEGGALSEPVRRRPYTVVLLDEIEKANSSVKDLFMQVFDRGMLQDADRRMINFSNTLIFMTSNLASEVLFEKYNAGQTDPDALLNELRPYLNRYFRPEFLGRVKPVVFLPLSTEIMEKIVVMKLDKLKKQLLQNQNLILEISSPVIKEIVGLCTRAETGARNIDAIIDRTMLPTISSNLLAFMAAGDSPKSLAIKKTKSGDFVYDFK